MNILDSALNFIFPKQCVICKKIGQYLCDKCENKIEQYKIELVENDSAFLFIYDGIIRKLLIDYKFNDCSYLCNFFCENIIKNKKMSQFIKTYDIIIPVPLHKKRQQERGYNQAELIAKKLSIKLVKDVLIKNKNIKPQSEKNVKQRFSEIAGVYSTVNINKIKNKKVLIFDDIYTTGSTCNECKKTLIQAGAKKVGIMTVARDYLK